jgi:rsbT co-antagonist protein RsbR
MQEWIENARTTLTQAATRALRANVAHNRSALPPFRLPQVAEQVVGGLAGFVATGDPVAARVLGERLADQGLGLRSLLAVVRGLVREALAEPGVDSDRRRVVPIVEDYADFLIEGLASWDVQDVVRQQDGMQAAAELAARARESELRQVIEELSAPIMPIHDRVLVLPVVGRVDDERARRITEGLLDEVGRRKARVVILDITGVEAVDAVVAAALVRTAKAVQLLGAEPLLVGIRPEFARVLVDAGVDLAGLRTQADLQGGISWALGRQGLAIRRVKG